MTLLSKLTAWQKQQSRYEGVEGYRVLPFSTLKLISQILPRNNKELLSIKGIGQVKVKKYGRDILNIVLDKDVSEQMNFSGVSHNNFVKNFNQKMGIFDESKAINDILESKVEHFLNAKKSKNENSTIKIEEDLKIVNIGYPTESEKCRKNKKKKLNIDKKTGEIFEDDSNVVSVSDFLSQINQVLNSYFSKVRIKGEIIGFKRNQNGHAYFELKDSYGIVRISVFKSAYELSGVSLEDGMEVIVTGKPEHHKRYGFSFIGEFVELAGEGELKKAYDDLKKKLELEGLFSLKKKKPIPNLPVRIGLITSKTSAAIGDFTTNLGKYGFKIIFCSSSVEGQNSVKELLEALNTLKKENLDLLVITRGGGSLESLKTFNNENVVRAIANFPVPIIAGIGHEQDETISTLVADRGVSTPTAAARIVRDSWDNAVNKLDTYENTILNQFQDMLSETEKYLNSKSNSIVSFFDNVFDKYYEYSHEIERGFLKIEMQFINEMSRCEYFEKIFKFNNPLRQLKLGYSIVKNKSGDIVNSTSIVKKGEKIDIALENGILEAVINNKKDNL